MSEIRPRVRSLFRLHRWSHTTSSQADASRELNDEMELHIALRAEQLVREGMTPPDAEREARRLFAQHHDTISELHEAAFDRNRHMRMRERWEAVWQDTRYAFRRLVREPAITAFILGILALGIGINVASFSVVDRVLLRGPQFVRDPDQLVRLYIRADQPPLGKQTMAWMPHSAFRILRDNMRSVQAMGAYRVGESMVGSGANSEVRPVSMMSSEMFALLGVQPVKGRFFGASEDADNVAILAERYWRTTLGSDPDIIGKSIAIDDAPHTVIGIAPAGFTGPELRRVDVWTPITITARNSMNMEVVARLKPHMAVDALTREVSQFRPQVEAVLPGWGKWMIGADYLAAPMSYGSTAHRSFESVMAWWLAAISALILFTSCANVANLLLARLARRRRELAVRVALGSGRSRVMRLLAIEGLLLAIGASILAFIVIIAIEPVLQTALFPSGSWAFSLFDVRILGAVAAFTLITGALVSVVPAIQAGRRDVSDALRSGNRAGELRSPLRSALTVVQAMLSVVLLVGAGLFVRSMQRVNAVDLGMQPDRVLTIEPRYSRIARNTGESFEQWLVRSGEIERTRYRALVEVARRVPGVEHAAVTVGVPFYGSFSVGLSVPGRDSIPALPGGGPYVTAVADDYFTTMGTAIRRGRAFNASDREGSEPVLIVSETMARALWPGVEPIGQCVVVGKHDGACARVVGIAADGHRNGLKEDPSMQFYLPIGQEKGFSGSALLVRPRGIANTAWPELRLALQNSDPSIRSLDVRLLSQGLDGEMRPLRLGMIAFGLSASLALIVAALGLYSVMAHAVAWRRHEIGVRLALGARPSSIATLIVRRGAQLATVGTGFGLLVALGARSWVEPLLFNTSARDPLVFSVVVVAIECVALLAAWLPAQRAVAVSPTEALRAE